jgi:hypothetical protein
MELHPTPESWRVALFTAFGAAAIAAAGIWVAVVFAGLPALLTGGILVALAGIATLLPAIGALSAAVDADAGGVTIRRFGRESRYPWDAIVEVRVLERRANVPDGTEYHWVVPNRRTHVVAVPSLTLSNGQVREIPALAGPADGPRAGAAAAYAALLTEAHARETGPGDGQATEDTNVSMRSQTKAMSSSASE